MASRPGTDIVDRRLIAVLIALFAGGTTAASPGSSFDEFSTRVTSYAGLRGQLEPSLPHRSCNTGCSAPTSC